MATSDIALERVQALLKVDTGCGSLYTHVVRVVRALAAEKPADALSQLETLSRHLKQSSFRGDPAPDEVQAVVHDAAAERRRKQWCVDVLKLVKPPSDPVETTKVLGVVQSFMEDASMLEWAGVGFGKQEAFHISMSLRKLAAETESLERVRLWGKVLGIEGDYFVAEGTLQTVPGAGVVPPALPGTAEYDVERPGEGANALTYWVSAGGAAPWSRLPAARASHIVAARQIKHLMTGDLGSSVNSMPWFSGKERHLLRAQIARISATCTLAPTGFYETDDADDAPKNRLRAAEGAEFPGSETLGTLEGWQHCAPALLSTGRCGWPDMDAFPEGSLTEETINAINDRKENEPEKAMLEGIAGDLEELKPEGFEGSPGWNVKVYGDKATYTFPEGAKSYRVAAIRSLIWPGAITVAQGSRFVNLYAGYGMKCGTLVPPKMDNGLQVPLAGTTAVYQTHEEVMVEPDDHEEVEEPAAQDEQGSDGEEMDAADQ